MEKSDLSKAKAPLDLFSCACYGTLLHCMRMKSFFVSPLFVRMVWDIASSHAHKKKIVSPLPLFKVVCIKKIHQVMKNDDLGRATIRFCPGANLNNGPREKDFFHFCSMA